LRRALVTFARVAGRGGEAWPELGGWRLCRIALPGVPVPSLCVRPAYAAQQRGMVIQAVVPLVGDRQPVVPPDQQPPPPTLRLRSGQALGEGRLRGAPLPLTLGGTEGGASPPGLGGTEGGRSGGRSGRIFRRPVEQLLVEYYQRGQYDQRLEREPEQWQREQQR